MSKVKFVTEDGEELSKNEAIQRLMKRVSDLEKRVYELENPFSLDRITINSAESNDTILSFPDYPQAAAYVPFDPFGSAGTDTISFSLNDDG